MKSYTNSWGREVRLEEAVEPSTYVNAFGRTVPVDPAATVREEGAVHMNAYGRPVPDGYTSLAPAKPAREATRRRVEAAEARPTPPQAGTRQEQRSGSPKRRRFEIEESGGRLAAVLDGTETAR